MARLNETDMGNFRYVAEAGMVQLGEERLTGAAAAQLATIPTGTRRVRIAAEVSACRWTMSGTATATSGGYLAADNVEWLPVQEGALLSIYIAGSAYVDLVYLGI